MISEGVEVNYFVQICLILETKFGNDFLGTNVESFLRGQNHNSTQEILVNYKSLWPLFLWLKKILLFRTFDSTCVILLILRAWFCSIKVYIYKKSYQITKLELFNGYILLIPSSCFRNIAITKITVLQYTCRT